MKRSAGNFFSTQKFFFKIIGRTSNFFYFDLLLSVFSSFVDNFTMVFVFRFTIMAFTRDVEFSNVLLFLSITAAVNFVICYVNNFVESKSRPAFHEKLKQVIDLEFFRKSTAIPYPYYDNNKTYDELVWMSENGSEKIIETMGNYHDLVKALTSITTLSTIMLTVSPESIFLVMVFVLLSLLITTKINKLKYRLEIETKKDKHVLNYIDRLFYEKKYSQDMRFYKLSSYFKDKYSNSADKLSCTISSYGHKIWFLTVIKNFFLDELPIYILYTLWLAYRVLVLKVLTLADFSTLFTSVDVLKNNIFWLFMIVPELKKNALYINDMKQFLEIHEVKTGGTAHIAADLGDIKFDKVSFDYGVNNEFAINDLSLQIKNKQKIAVVGYNGAGKSTLIKLILGLYHTASGEVKINNVNNKAISMEQRIELMAYTPQIIEVYACNIQRNIALSIEQDMEKCRKTLLAANFDIPFDMERDMTTEFFDEGYALSGGQKQLLAIARAIYRNTPIILMDEPTSALDPEHEYQFNNQIKNIARDKTLLIVSHRLTTTAFMDYIIMMDEGKIVETGTHEELMKKAGKYAYMYSLQAKKYRG